MKYKVGMYGGGFDPLHTGHLRTIVQAAAVCDSLYVVISWSKERDHVDRKIRYRWILNSCRHLPNVQVVLVEDRAASKADYDLGDYWEQGAAAIKAAVEWPIDAVFCGDDYRRTGRFEGLYPDAEVVYFERQTVNISSTQIRENPLRYWDYLPAVCRPYYTGKVLVLGGESTGKSTLVQNLALVYQTNFVSEVGRDTCEYAGGEELMIAGDLYENLVRQRLNIMDALKDSNRLLFVDTDSLTTLFYSNFLLTDSREQEICTKLAEAINESISWDLILFLEPTVAFVQDGTRNETIAADRVRYSNEIKQILDRCELRYHCIDGDYLERFHEAVALIEEHLGVR